MQDVAHPTTRNTEHRADLGLAHAAGVEFSDALIAFALVGGLFLAWRGSVETCYNRGNCVRDGVSTNVPYLAVETLWARWRVVCFPHECCLQMNPSCLVETGYLFSLCRAPLAGF